ncbi:hypothetical protein C8A01DRAFT_39855 [Parachaetomium inaequale]|uniref:Uncharacterized protein n=1 Tax=Parachaetomium inaequale TaxID=2588326 RepID=A0AAN6PCU5_9PEZI|nr:hypothetical protein C8A01DRAFT_39855 [Parachaetomium inaequale]
MAQFQVEVDVQEAIEKAGSLSREKMKRFNNALYSTLPRWVGPGDLDAPPTRRHFTSLRASPVRRAFILCGKTPLFRGLRAIV